ncbi:MAG: hypothetical protein GX660_08645, partial [Clostridiaceae bacterium]|nr:hypothetical protein [Clostridiaceae bacterium]
HTFEGISINTDKVMYAGKLVAVKDSARNAEFMSALQDQPWGDGTSSGQENEYLQPLFEALEIIVTEDPITSITVDEDGDIIVTYEDGETEEIDYPDQYPIIVADSEGNQYLVDEGGEATLITPDMVAAAEASNAEIANLESTISSDIANSLKFIIGENDYINNDSYYTYYNKKKIEIKIVKIDDNVDIDLTTITWKLENKEIPSKNDSPEIIEFTVDNTTLPKYSNNLLVLNNEGKALIKIKIKTYDAPVIKFDEDKLFKGEYFFDHGYEFTSIASNTYYNTILVGKKNDVYYAPVLGLDKDQAVTIQVIPDQFNGNIPYDPKFEVVFKPDLPGKVLINNQDSLILDGISLDNLTDINIKAIDYVDNNDIENLTPMHINVLIRSTREKVGMLEFYCAKKIDKEVELIYTMFSDETNYPSYLTDQVLSTFLTTNSMNQLFLNFTVSSTQYSCTTYTTTQMQGLTNQQIIDNLNNDKYGRTTPTGYSSTKDYFYLTNLDIPSLNNPNAYLGGFHKVGYPGGVQVKFRTTPYHETAEAATAHEFGHWLGLPHTWDSRGLVPVIHPNEGGTKDNFMDYKINRKKWLKVQLLNYTR